ncbi:MAG: hypothetical protein CXZ00_11630 [Acidobacteria bacterium]|nr:MAG: hypothetical protein CXZ00_11630 [Acidobacteriota bacterium]
MPLYEYKCKACAHHFERIVKFSDAPLTICPECGKNQVEQMISAPAVLFKGSGWYVTDYARKNTSPGASSVVKQEAASESVSASKDSSGESTVAASASTSSSDGSSNTAAKTPSGSATGNSGSSSAGAAGTGN